MTNILLYALVVLIWGSTWIAITFQLGEVPTAWSLVYRFALACAALFAWALIRRIPVGITLRQHPMVALQGIFMFCINYALIYQGTQYVTSGLVAVLFTALMFFNLINERLFFGTPFSPRVVTAALMGFTGLVLVFWPELDGLGLGGDSLTGALLVLGGALSASFGNMAAIRNTNWYELALVGPDCPNAVPPVYTCGYSDQLEDVGADGTYPVPTGPGLGVTYDWDFIAENRTGHHVFEER